MISNNHNGDDSVQKEVSLVFIGETGSGKTTLLTSLEDMLDLRPFEMKRITPQARQKGKSQTKDCNQFILKNQEWILKIIDTPGLGDTEGIEYDDSHVDKIIDILIEKSEFNAICFIMRRGTVRSTILIKYVITELRTMLPKDSQNNFIICLTASEIPIPGDDTLAVIKDLCLPEENIICIDNVAYEQMKIDTNSFKGKHLIKKLECSYKDNYHNLLQLLETAWRNPLYKSTGIKDLKIKRDLLSEEIALLNQKIDDGFHAETQMKRIQRELQIVKEEMDENKDFMLNISVERKIPFKKTGKVTTHCIACFTECHVNCTLSYGDDLISCEAMIGQKCKKCGCTPSMHTHLGWDFRLEYENATKEDENKKKRLDFAKIKKGDLDYNLKVVKEKIENEQKNRLTYQKAIQNLYDEINKIALVGYNHVYEDLLTFQIKNLEKSTENKEYIESKKIFYQKSLDNFRNFLHAIRK